MRYIAVFFFFFCLLFQSAPSLAGIYRYIDENGVIHFTNCPRDAKFKLYLRESKDDVGEEIRTASLPYTKDSDSYDALIDECSKKYEVDFALIKAIIRAESGFNPSAISRKGAKGLMQLMPATASRLKVSNSFNPRE